MSSPAETMSPVQDFRDFITQRLTAAAAEIFTVFEQTVAQYEEELERQRRLLQVGWRPGIKLHRIENADQPVCEEDELWDQEEAVQLKEEEEDEEEVEAEVRIDCDDREPPWIKEEAEAPEIAADLEERRGAREDRQLAEGFTEEFMLQGPLGGGASGSSGDLEPGQSRLGTDTDGPAPSRILRRLNVDDDDRLEFVIIGDELALVSQLQDERRGVAAEKPFLCKTCGKRFRLQRSLCLHTRTHTGERPHCCEVCGKRFRQPSHLLVHRRIHTGEKPYSCKTCGQTFRQYGNLFTHSKRHARAAPDAPGWK
ncbi:zinc finger protein 316-like [Salarias fasciatus]|uniref:zinc finger protein 316-like n=1 Tax=Salarias fasciatus TaxID=181472 RepID=UPI001176E79D|nr:zinc finger protein 316-like [Salarias fasciatus]